MGGGFHQEAHYRITWIYQISPTDIFSAVFVNVLDYLNGVLSPWWRVRGIQVVKVGEEKKCAEETKSKCYTRCHLDYRRLH